MFHFFSSKRTELQYNLTSERLNWVKDTQNAARNVSEKKKSWKKTIHERSSLDQEYRDKKVMKMCMASSTTPTASLF